MNLEISFQKLGKDFEYQFDADFEEIYIPTKDGATINALLFKKENSKGLVFYFKGNTRSIKGWGKFSRDFLDLTAAGEYGYAKMYPEAMKLLYQLKTKAPFWGEPRYQIASLLIQQKSLDFIQVIVNGQI